MIRFAEIKDIPTIMTFIDIYWKKDHILARDPSFFKYQHQQGDQVSFVLSLDEENQINGVLGYIPYGEDESSDVMDALWKVMHTDNPFLGMELLKFLTEHKKARLVASPGINTKTIALYRFLKYHVGEMMQWYRLSKNGNIMKHIIGRIENFLCPNPTAEQWTGVELSSFTAFEASFQWGGYSKETVKPYKEPSFIKHRYFEHPIYHYRVFGLQNKDELMESALVVREQEYRNAKILRVIDCIGKSEQLIHATHLIDLLMEEIGAEYTDLYQAGIDDALMGQGGWLKAEGSQNIFPDYFAPFLQKAVKIHYFSTDSQIVLFKGDGDQDRPS